MRLATRSLLIRRLKRNLLTGRGSPRRLHPRGFPRRTNPANSRPGRRPCRGRAQTVLDISWAIFTKNSNVTSRFHSFGAYCGVRTSSVLKEAPCYRSHGNKENRTISFLL